jgi:hypothetical protein
MSELPSQKLLYPEALWQLYLTADLSRLFQFQDKRNCAELNLTYAWRMRIFACLEDLHRQDVTQAASLAREQRTSWDTQIEPDT